MKIAIDVSQVVYGTGVSSYTFNLVKHLKMLDRQNEYVLYAGSLRRRGEILKLYPEAKIFPIPPTLGNIVWNKLHVFSIEKLIGKVDVLHTSDWTEPPSKAFKVTTVHDLAPFLFPELFPRDILRNIVSVHKSKLSWVRAESNRIICPTEATKADLVRLGFDANKIRVVPEAVSETFRPATPENISLTKARLGIHGEYFLAVGLDPRKNTDRLVKAFEHACAGREIKLVIVGNPKYVSIKENRKVKLLGHVENSMMPALYSDARALLHPSLYEGFGLPILEAMACGTTVLTSNISSMSEVAGAAAILVDPYSIESIGEGIEKVLRGSKSFSDKGFKRVKDFSWENTAKMTLAIYKEIIK